MKVNFCLHFRTVSSSRLSCLSGQWEKLVSLSLSWFTSDFLTSLQLSSHRQPGCCVLEICGSILSWLVTIDQNDLKVLGQHIIQREEPLYSQMIMCQGSPSASLSCYPAQGVSNVKVLTDVHSVTQPAIFFDILMSDPPLTRWTILR